MKTLAIVTPTLKKVEDVADTVISGILDGTLDKTDANILCKAGSLLNQAMNVEVKVRLFAGRIHAQEAKLIEGQPVQQQALPQAAD